MELPPRQGTFDSRRCFPQPRLTFLLNGVLKQRLQRLHHPNDVLIALRPWCPQERPPVYSNRIGRFWDFLVFHLEKRASNANRNNAKSTYRNSITYFAHSQILQQVLALFQRYASNLVAVGVLQEVYSIRVHADFGLSDVARRSTKGIGSARDEHELVADHVQQIVR